MTDLKMKVYTNNDPVPVFAFGWEVELNNPIDIRANAHEVLDSALDHYLSEEEK